MLLRGPSILPRGILQNNLPDAARMSQQDYFDAVFLMLVARKTGDPEQYYGLNGIGRSVFLDPEQYVARLRHQGYIAIQTAEDTLQTMTVPELQELLYEHELQTHGPKKLLIRRALTYLNGSVLDIVTDTHPLIIPSEAGWEVIAGLYVLRMQAEQACFHLIKQRNIEQALDVIDQYEERQPIHYSHTNCTDDEFLVSQQILDEHEYDADSVAAVCSYFWGGSLLTYKPKKKYLGRFAEMRKVANTKQSIADFMRGGGKWYSVLAAFDNKTCFDCALHSLRMYECEKAIIGVNAPPFHEGCRCCVISFQEPWDTRGIQTRYACDPVTKKAYYVPKKFTFFQWYYTLSPTQRSAFPEKVKEQIENSEEYCAAEKSLAHLTGDEIAALCNITI